MEPRMLRTVIARDELAAGRLVTVTDEAGAETLALLLRRAGDDPSLSEWDRRQNYARFVGDDGLVLECVVATEPPQGLIDRLRAQQKTVSPELERGLLRLGVPLALLGGGAQWEVVVRLDGPRIALIVDGILRDEEWPAGPWQRGSAVSAALAVEFLTDVPEAPTPLPPLTRSWTPSGHNAWAGDVMLTADGDRLHLFWLADRRMHGSKFGCGAHSFAHASTADLQHWEHHPPAYPVSESWEASNGTGCTVVRRGVHHLFANVLSERLGVEARHPNGPHLATSRDGVHYAKEGRVEGLPGEPGIIRDEQGLWHAISVSRHSDGVWRSSRYESTDLRSWRLADPAFLPEPGWPTSRTVFSGECFNWFRWRQWYYILGGRTGFWRSPRMLGPYRSANDADGPQWDVYDGLMVPQVAVWKGRAILGGWLPLNDRDWAGHLVFRELRQLPDGSLEMRRLRAARAGGGAERPCAGLPPGDGRPVRPALGGRPRAELRRTGTECRQRCFRGSARHRPRCTVRPGNRDARRPQERQHGGGRGDRRAPNADRSERGRAGIAAVIQRRALPRGSALTRRRRLNRQLPRLGSASRLRHAARPLSPGLQPPERRPRSPGV